MVLGLAILNNNSIVYPLVMTNKKLLKMAIEIVELSIKNGGSFHSYVNVYQRVIQLPSMTTFLQSKNMECHGRGGLKYPTVTSSSMVMRDLPTE